jgi:Na+-transporting methylmalonyl-CoA/oxaloacetate decarboxylase gamma subunit
MDMLGVGLEITLLGMGLVFTLLALLWGLIAGLLRLDARAAVPDTAAERLPAQQVTAAEQPGAIPAELLAALTVAALTHRTLLRQQAAPSTRHHQPGSHLHASRWVATGRSRQNRSWLSRRG